MNVAVQFIIPQMKVFMNKTGIWEYLFLFVLAFLLLACTSESNTINKNIDQQEAIDIAMESALMSMPEMTGSQVEPTDIRAEKMTLAEAAKHLNSNTQNTFSQDSSDTDVWLVSMDGIWLPAKAPDVPDQKEYRHLFIVIDAKTGQEIYRMTIHNC